MFKLYTHMFGYSEIINLLFSRPDYLLNVREIARQLHQNVAKTSKLLNELIGAGLVKYQESGRSKIVSLNFEEQLFASFVLMSETYKKIKFMETNGVFGEFIKQVEKLDHVYVLVIFGSYARGTPTKESDLDMLIVTDGEYKGGLPSYILPVKIHEIRMEHDLFSDALIKKEALLKEILENHVIIKGLDMFIGDIIEKYGK